MSVARAQSEIDSREFAEWMCIHRMDPIGTDRADLGAAIVASTIANVNSTKRRFKPSDFMPRWGREIKPRQSVSEMKRILNMAGAAAVAAKKRRNG